MVPRWGSGRLVRHKSGQEAILDRYTDRYADPWGRFGRAFGVMLGFMLGSCWHLFGWWFFDAVRTSFCTPTWSEIEAKIEPKTFPKTFKLRTWKSVPKMIENKLNFDRKIIDFLTWFLVIFQCVACRVFALVGMSGCLKNVQKRKVLERFLNIDNFAWTWDCLRNLIEDEAEIGLVCRLILEEFFDWFLIDFDIDLGSEIAPKWGRKSNWKGDLKKKGKRWAYRGQLGVQDGVMLGWKSKKIGVKKVAWKKEA